MLWDKASLVSMDEVRQFYVRDLQPFVSIRRVRRQSGGLQQRGVAEVQAGVDANNVTLYGSTQLAVDLAELAAEAGNETLAVDFAGFTQSQTASKGSTEEPTAAGEEYTVPADVPMALDGFCLQSSSVSFLHFRKHSVYGCQ